MLHLFSRRLARNYTSSSLSATTTSATMEPLLAKAGCTFTGDRFGGVTITFESQSQNIHWNKAFASILHAWAKEKKYRGVWLQLNPATNPMAGTVMQASVESAKSSVKEAPRSTHAGSGSRQHGQGAIRPRGGEAAIVRAWQWRCPGVGRPGI